MNASLAAPDEGLAFELSFGRRVSFDRRLLVVTLIAAAMFVWPLFAYGRPANFQDSAAYYKGGHRAVSFAVAKIMPETAVSSRSSPGGVTANADSQPPHETKGSRSVAYSVLAYVLGAPNAQMWLLVVAQAIAAGFATAVGLLLLDQRMGDTAAKAAMLAVGTPVAFVVCLVVPDLFAGLVIFFVALLATAFRSLSPAVRIASAVLATAGIAFHASHLPIGLGITAAAVAWLFVSKRRGAHVERAQWAWLVAPFLVAAITTVALNAVAFGGASLTGKRYPLTLARSIAEGPGKWYLDRNCGHLRYAICEVYPHGVPSRVDEFLWGKNGINSRATLEQLDRIRAEESEVVFKATAAYPAQEIGRLTYSISRQLTHFQPDVGWNNRIVLTSDGIPVTEPAPHNPIWWKLVGWLSIGSVLASLVFLAARWRILGDLRPLVGLVVFGILLNAAVCVYFSGISERYQARVIWLVPLLALMALAPAGRRVVEGQGASQG